MKKINVIHIIPDLGLGGGQKLVVDLLINQNRKMFNITLISLYPSLNNHYSKILEDNGINIIYLNKKKGLDLKTILDLNKLFFKLKPQIVNTHLYTIKYAFIPCIFNGVKINYHTVHNIANKEAYGIDKILQKILFKCNFFIPIAISSQIKKSILDFYKLKDIPLIYNGIDTQKYISGEINYKKPLRIVNVSRFEEQKNHLFMLEIVKKLKSKNIEFQLDLIGDGYLRDKIDKFIIDNNLDDVVNLLGTKSNIHEFLFEYDIFLMTSLYEGLPLVILEACSAGLTVISTDVGGIPDIIKHNENGYLFKGDNIDSFVEKIIVLDENRNLLEKNSKKSIEIANKYDIRVVQKQYEDLYFSRMEELDV